jgi:hypothetical protein
MAAERILNIRRGIRDTIESYSLREINLREEIGAEVEDRLTGLFSEVQGLELPSTFQRIVVFTGDKETPIVRVLDGLDPENSEKPHKVLAIINGEGKYMIFDFTPELSQIPHVSSFDDYARYGVIALKAIEDFLKDQTDILRKKEISEGFSELRQSFSARFKDYRSLSEEVKLGNFTEAELLEFAITQAALDLVHKFANNEEIREILRAFGTETQGEEVIAELILKGYLERLRPDFLDITEKGGEYITSKKDRLTS